MANFSQSLSDLTSWKNHVEEHMNSEQEDLISLHGGDDFSVGDAEPPKKKQKSGAFRGPENDDF